jgi:DNA-binding HxlR family transcriptional regulator
MKKIINNQNGIGCVYFSEEVGENKTGLNFNTSPQFQKLVEDIQKYLVFSRENIKLVLGVYLANNIEGNPVWVLIVSPSSSGKTELIFLLKQAENVILLSDLTPQTFISGKDREAGLLLKIPSGIPTILLIKDFTTILELPKEKRCAIFSQLREIYDGKYSKAFGTGEKIDWEGKIGIIGGVTQIWEVHYSASQILGERFLLWRLNYTDEEKREIILKSLNNQEKIKIIRTELPRKIKEFLNLISQEKKNIVLTQNETEYVITLSELVAKGRSQVRREGYKREIELIPDEEYPTRIATQLSQLLKGLKLIEDNPSENLQIIKKIAIDTIPDKKKKIIEIFLREENPLKLSQLTELIKLPETTLTRTLEELEIRGILVKKGRGIGYANEWFLNEEWKEKLLNFEGVETLKVLDNTYKERGSSEKYTSPHIQKEGGNMKINDKSELNIEINKNVNNLTWDDIGRIREVEDWLKSIKEPEGCLKFLEDISQDKPKTFSKILNDISYVVSTNEYKDIKYTNLSQIEKALKLFPYIPSTLYARIIRNDCGFQNEIYEYIYEKYLKNGGAK